MAVEFDIVDQIDRGTAELLEESDAIIAYGETDIFRLEPRDEDE